MRFNILLLLGFSLLFINCSASQKNSKYYSNETSCVRVLATGDIVINSFGQGPSYSKAVNDAKINALDYIIHKGFFGKCQIPSVVSQVTYQNNLDYFRNLLAEDEIMNEYLSFNDESIFKRIVRKNYGTLKDFKVQIEVTIKYEGLKIKIHNDLNIQ